MYACLRPILLRQSDPCEKDLCTVVRSLRNPVVGNRLLHTGEWAQPTPLVPRAGTAGVTRSKSLALVLRGGNVYTILHRCD